MRISIICKPTYPPKKNEESPSKDELSLFIENKVSEKLFNFD